MKQGTFSDHNTGFLDLCDVMPLPMGTLLEMGVAITMATEPKHNEGNMIEEERGKINDSL